MVGELQAATQNQLLWTITILHGELKATSKRKKKSLLMCIVQSRSELHRKTFALLSYVFLQCSRARWSHQLHCTNTQPELQEREQRWKQRESRWLSGITDWIYPGVLCTEWDIVQTKLHRYPQAQLCDGSSKNPVQSNTGTATTKATWVPTAGRNTQCLIL